MGADFLCGVAVHCPSMQGVLQNAPWMYSRWDLVVSLSLSGAQACRRTSHKRGRECADLTSQGASPMGKRDEFGVSGYCSCLYTLYASVHTVAEALRWVQHGTECCSLDKSICE